MKLIFTTLACLVLYSLANAQVFVKHDAAGLQDGTSWENAYSDLQDALDNAAPGDEVWIAAGTYIPEGPSPAERHFIALKPIKLYGGFAGTETSLDQRDWDINKTIFSGDVNGDDQVGVFNTNRNDNAHHILIIDSGNERCFIDGINFISGSTKLDTYAPTAMDSTGYNRWRGGALYLHNSPATIQNCIFKDNNARDGSSIYARNLSQTTDEIYVSHSIFEGNNGTTGGTLFVSAWKGITVNECEFKSNLAASFGAALSIFNTYSIIENCLFDQNYSASQGGACYISNQTASLNPYLVTKFKGCQFTKNTTSVSGGAIRFSLFAFGFEISFDSCQFVENSTLGNGSYAGAIYVGDYYDTLATEVPNTILITNCTMRDNSSYYGGAMEVDASDDSLNIVIENSAFLRNICSYEDGYAGAIYIWSLYDVKLHTRITETLFERNSGANAGALAFDAYNNTYPLTYTLDNCQFIQNQALNFGGAVFGLWPTGPGNIGWIQNSNFKENIAGLGGAIASATELLNITGCNFDGNYVIGFDPEINGAGAVHCFGVGDITLQNSIFKNNSSVVDAAAITANNGVTMTCENLLFHGNIESPTIKNWGQLNLINCSLIGNDSGLLLLDSSQTTIQNSIFENNFENLLLLDQASIISKGGNISSDATLSTYLTGYDGYIDLHNTDPLLGPDFIPMAGSPCIDAGNPEGIMMPTDLAGNPRNHGAGIDIGAYESYLVATKYAAWESPGLIIYPNPVQDIAQIEIENNWTGPFDLIIFNHSGQTVYSDTHNKSATKEIFAKNVDRLPAGEYILLVKSIHGSHAAMMIVQR